MISARFDQLRAVAREIQPHHRVMGSSATGRIGSSSPREGFVGDPTPGIFQHPVIVDGVTLDDALYRNETFGPIVPVASFGTFDEALTLANDHGYGLSSSIYTTDPKHAFRFREGVTAGWSASTTRPPGRRRTCPSAGTASRGPGARQSGVWMLDQVTRWQSMNWDFSGRLQKAQMDIAEIEADVDFRIFRI
jgi:alpha-ketoglutaric semialdehyde dehydrogenase